MRRNRLQPDHSSADHTGRGRSPVWTMIGGSFASFFRVLPALLLFEVVYKFLCNVIFRPLLAQILQGALDLSGHHMVFNGDIAGFFTNAPGIIASLLLCIFAAFLAYYEFAVIILMIYYRYTGSPVSLSGSMKMALTTFRSLRSPGLIGFAFYALGLLPLIDLGFAPSIRPEGEIPNFISGELYKSTFGSILMVLFYVLMYLLFFCAVFVLPAMVLRRHKFGRAFRLSLTFVLSARLGRSLPLLLTLALWCGLFLYPGVIPTYYAGISDTNFAEILGNFFFSWKGLFHFLLVEGLQICLMILLFTFLVSLYLLHGGRVSLNEQAMPAIDRRLERTQNIAARFYAILRRGLSRLAGWIRGLAFYQKHRRPIWAVVISLLFLGVFGLLYSQPASYDQVVVGHRGSQAGVENTVQAVQGAIDADADYAEIDVQLSKDGIPVVIHDDNLKRLTGEDIHVYDQTAAQLSQLTLSQKEKTGKISTLDQVIDYARGEIDLLIELKLHGHEKADLVKAVVQVIERNHFQKNCQIMSLEYDLIEELKTDFPSYTAGYCVYGNLGQAQLNSLRQLNVDFLVIEENMASKGFIAECERAWLPVYVWTVNKTQSMESCLQMGASGLITDKPQEARKLIDRFRK